MTHSHRPHHPSIAASLSVRPLHQDFPLGLLFVRSEGGSFLRPYGIRLLYTGPTILKCPPKDSARRIKRLAQGRYCQVGVRTRDLQSEGSLKSSSSSSSYNLQRALKPIAKMNLCVWLARMPMKATGFAVGVSRARPWTAPSSWLEQ